MLLVYLDVKIIPSSFSLGKKINKSICSNFQGSPVLGWCILFPATQRYTLIWDAAFLILGGALQSTTRKNGASE